MSQNKLFLTYFIFTFLYVTQWSKSIVTFIVTTYLGETQNLFVFSFITWM
jgi:hypothetical protein